MKPLAAALAALVLFVVPLPGGADDAAVMQVVDKTVALWQEKGRDDTLQILNNPAGPLRSGPFYAFVCDFTGQMLAHPVQESLRNLDTWEMQDTSGRFIVQEFIKAARSEEGFGFVEYDWLRVNSSEPVRKRTFVKRIPGEDILVGCGLNIESR
jgi:signal transduction histidine kinase